MTRRQWANEHRLPCLGTGSTHPPTYAITPHGSMDPDHSSDGVEILLANRQSAHPVDEDRLVAAARCVLQDSPFGSASVSLAVVDDSTIHELNRRYLDHDWPTDVLSFVLDQHDDRLEGEVIVSADTAAAAAGEFGWSAADELLLYTIHGMLHLVGYDDKSDDDVREMRAAEQRYLRQLGVDSPRAAPTGAGGPGIDAGHRDEGGNSAP